MYEDYYRFDRRPFSLTPDPEFLFKSTSHQEALEQLLRGIRRREGFLVLTGDIGTGKTLIWRSLIDQLGPKTFTAAVLNPFLSDDELLRAMLQDFGVVSQAEVRDGRFANASKPQLIDTLNRFLLSLMPLGASAVLIVDEAQNLTPRLLEQIRVLTNLETAQEKLLQVLLVGQLELRSVLRSPEMGQLDQRVSRRCTLRPLGPTEVEDYVAHRLRVAHSPWDVGFTAKAFEFIYQLSGGIPRKINLLCDRALEVGCDALTPAITHELVLKAAERLELVAPAQSRRRVSPVATRGMTVAAGVVAGTGIAAALYLLPPIVNPAQPVVPPAPLGRASVALPQPVDFADAAAGLGAVPLGRPADSYSVLVATYPEPVALAAAATLKELDYRVFELGPSGQSQEVEVLVGPYADLDQAR